MSVSKKMQIVGQKERPFANPCNESTCGEFSVSRVLAKLARQGSTLFSPAPRSATPKSGKSGHGRTSLGRHEDWKSNEKCHFQGAKPSVRTKSGHFRLRAKDVELSSRRALLAHDEVHH